MKIVILEEFLLHFFHRRVIFVKMRACTTFLTLHAYLYLSDVLRVVALSMPAKIQFNEKYMFSHTV